MRFCNGYTPGRRELKGECGCDDSQAYKSITNGRCVDLNVKDKIPKRGRVKVNKGKMPPSTHEAVAKKRQTRCPFKFEKAGSPSSLFDI